MMAGMAQNKLNSFIFIVRGGSRVRQVSHATYFFLAENELLVFWSVWKGGTSCPIHILRYLCVLELDS